MIGARLGPYEIAGAIGAGGMGEVFRARDTKLNRDVAIKVLPAAFAQDHERVARFRREAQALASLNHPNIAAIHGLEESELGSGSGQGTVIALVLELVEGEDLAERLKRGAIPLEEALAIAKQVALGLEEAHDHGIIHRDLKPANIKVTPDGKVKVLDFGLAKAFENDAAPNSGSSQLSQSPTMSRHMTEAGLILGTAAYMSPEQARGKAVDKRTDIWAFGVVCYEIFTGRRLFEGETVSDVVAAVLTREPDWAALPVATPAAARRLLRQCLERNPKNRLHDIADARLALEEKVAGGPDEPGSRGRGPEVRKNRVIAALATLTVGLALALAVMARRLDQPAPSHVVRFALSADPSIRPDTRYTTPFAISADGRTIVFVARDESPRSYLWVRALDDPRARKLDDTEGGLQPALSPDGEWVAFLVESRHIRKVRLSGGASTPVATLDGWSAALTWATDTEILAEILNPGMGIRKVSANGGVPAPLIPLDAKVQEERQRRPFALRRERVVLYASTTADGRTGLASFSLADGRRTRLEVEGVQALGVIEGRLVYSHADGSLMAVPLDLRAMRVTGAPTQLGDRVTSSPFGTVVALSESGTLVYGSAETAALRLLLVDMQGRSRPFGADVRAFRRPRFSPDGRRIVVTVGTGDGVPSSRAPATGELWIYDRESGQATRLTLTGEPSQPEWSPDGKRLIYLSATSPRRHEVWALTLDGGAPPRRLVEIEGDVTSAVVTPDLRSLLAVREREGQTAEELLLVPLDGRSSPSLLAGPGVAGSPPHLSAPRISPDGRWIAFTDWWETYVRALDGAGVFQMSDGGGYSPSWGADSRHLYYSTNSGWVVATLQTSPTLAVVGRRSLGEFPFKTEDYDLSPDGQTLIVVAPAHDAPALVALHWGDEVRRLLRGASNP